MTPEQWAKIIDASIWPTLTFLVFAIFFRHIRRIILMLAENLENGSDFHTPWVSICKPPAKFEALEKGGKITSSHIALVHSSWRIPRKDKEYRRPMYCFHAIIQGNDEVLDRIESVTYSLHKSYPNPIQVITNRKSRFKLKELAYGESNLIATVHIKNQEETVKLTRYINLTETGPKI